MEDADDEVEEPWMTLLNQCSTLGCAWYGDEEAIRPCRRSEPSSSDAEEVSGGVHASTEDCTRTERLLEGIGIFLSLYFAKAACTASV